MTKDYWLLKFSTWFNFDTRLDYEYAKASAELCKGLIEFKFSLDKECVNYKIGWDE